MKHIFRFVTVVLIFALVFPLLTSCGDFLLDHDSNNSDTPQKTVTVHYYDDVTRNYEISSSSDAGTETEFLAPKGKRIIGIFDQYGVQYADENCKLHIRKDGPSDLYAKYEDAVLSYVGDVCYEEDPHTAQFYSTHTFSHSLKGATASSLACNPYAKVNVTVKFMLKGSGRDHYNRFRAKFVIKGEEFSVIDEIKQCDSWTEFTMTSTVSAMQIVKNDYTIKSAFSSSYGYSDYMIKNIQLSLDILYDND